MAWAPMSPSSSRTTGAAGVMATDGMETKALAMGRQETRKVTPGFTNGPRAWAEGGEVGEPEEEIVRKEERGRERESRTRRWEDSREVRLSFPQPRVINEVVHTLCPGTEPSPSHPPSRAVECPRVSECVCLYVCLCLCVRAAV